MPHPLSPGIYLEEIPSGPPEIVSAESRIAAFIGEASKGSIKKAVRVASLNEFIATFGPLNTKRELGFAVSQFFANAGANASAWIVRVASPTSDAQFSSALAILEKVDLFNLLALPGVRRDSVLSAAADLCMRRRAILLVDPPSAAILPSELPTAFATAGWTQASFAALYYPWVYVIDPTRSQPRACAPSGTMAGVIARTDLQHGVWKSPAGNEATLNGVQSLTRVMTDAENATLNSQGINGLRKFPAVGYVAWGARTLVGADSLGSEWKYLSVRRTANLIEESVRRGLTWTAFESNDANLWTKVRAVLENYLTTLWRAGAFPGAKTVEAFYVLCDQRTTTASDIAAGRLIVQLGFAPLRPAEFVVLNLQLLASAT